MRASHSGRGDAAQARAPIIRRVERQKLPGSSQLIIKLGQRDARFSRRHEVSRFMLDNARDAIRSQDNITTSSGLPRIKPRSRSRRNQRPTFKRRQPQYLTSFLGVRRRHGETGRVHASVRRVDAARPRSYDLLGSDDARQRCVCGFDVEEAASEDSWS